MIATRPSSETRPAEGRLIDVPFTREFARAHEDAGFDRVLIGYYSDAADGFVVAGDVFAHTERLGVLLAHRPGFVAPDGGRAQAGHPRPVLGRPARACTSSPAAATPTSARDGDFLDHDARYRRTDEYLDILRAIWTAAGPFDHEGEFYRSRARRPAVRRAQQPHLPIYFGGSSDAAVAVGGPARRRLRAVGRAAGRRAAHIERVRAAAAAHGRSPRISLSLRPILGATEEAAWDRAHAHPRPRARAGAARGFGRCARPRTSARSACSRPPPRATCTTAPLHADRRGDRRAREHHRAGRYGRAGGRLAPRYYDIGVTTILIRGFDPLDDARDYAEIIRSRSSIGR